MLTIAKGPRGAWQCVDDAPVERSPLSVWRNSWPQNYLLSRDIVIACLAHVRHDLVATAVVDHRDGRDPCEQSTLARMHGGG